MSTDYLSNPILDVDSYKASHYLQYPPGTTRVHSYIESRGGAFDKVLFFGLQPFLKRLGDRYITKEDIEEAADILPAHGLPFNREDWEYIVEKHYGRMPVVIRALSEGVVVPTGIPLVTVENTDDRLPWLTSYIETALLRAVWYPTTVATLSWHCRQLIGRYLDETADSRSSLDFKLHDFGARGVSSRESAAIGGLAHLVSFNGTDTLSAILAARKYYDEPMAGFSIPAAEHSTITSWGRENEASAYWNMLSQFAKPQKLVAVVSDSYDLWHVIENIWGGVYRDQVQQCGGTLVIRPDSGNPTEVVVRAIKMLMSKFGSHTNTKGYLELPPCVRVIQGDGINLKSMEVILIAMKAEKLSADNVTFGMGGGLLQQVDRDTLKFAMKASAIEINGEWQDVYKDPITDPGKSSKRGRQVVTCNTDGVYQAKSGIAQTDPRNFLHPVFDGSGRRVFSLSEIRARARA